MRVVLHVGLQKSGTTYLQNGLHRASGQLAARGIHYPVPDYRRVDVPNHQSVFYGLVPDSCPWIGDVLLEHGVHDRAWLESRVPSLEGTLVLSAEAISVFRDDALDTIVEHFSDHDLSVVVTARSLPAMLASGWQQSVRAGRALGIDSYLEVVEADRDRVRSIDGADHEVVSPWRAYSAALAVSRWADRLGAEKVRLVTNAGSPPELLWSRFLSALEIPTEDQHALPAPALDDRDAHRGLHAAELDLLRDVNQLVEDWPEDDARVLREAVVAGFGSRDERGPRFSLPAHASALAGSWSEHERQELVESGVRVLGDLDDLAPDDGPARVPDEQDRASSASEALLAVAGLWREQRDALTATLEQERERLTSALEAACARHARLEGAWFVRLGRQTNGVGRLVKRATRRPTAPG